MRWLLLATVLVGCGPSCKVDPGRGVVVFNPEEMKFQCPDKNGASLGTLDAPPSELELTFVDGAENDLGSASAVRSPKGTFTTRVDVVGVDTKVCLPEKCTLPPITIGSPMSASCSEFSVIETKGGGPETIPHVSADVTWEAPVWSCPQVN